MANGREENRTLDLLRTHFDEWAEESGISDPKLDWEGRIRGIPVAIGVKSTRRGSLEDMKGRLAIAVLQLQRSANNLERMPVAMLHVPRVGGRAIDALGEFMREYAPNVGWGVFDDRGTFHLELPKEGIELHQEGRTSEEEVRKTTHNRQALLRQSDIEGVSPRQVRRIENGEVRARTTTLKSFAEAHGLSVNDYLNHLSEKMGEIRG